MTDTAPKQARTPVMLKKLALHASTYSVGSLLVTLASLISFPIFTRVFSVEEYGLLNLISATLSLLTGIAKMGVQNSIVRFYGEVKAGKRPVTLAQYYSTTVFGMMAAASIVASVWAIASQVIPSSWWNDPRVTGLMLLTSGLVIVRSVDSSLTNFLRAEERSGIFSTYMVVKKYVGLAAILLALFYVSRSLYGFYGATILAEVVAGTVLFAILFRERRYGPSQFSPNLFRTMLAFGVPMIAYELSGLILNVGDRYVIQSLLGSAALGVYSAGYNFCEYVQVILLASVGQAIMPMYVRMWEEKGEEATRRFLYQALHFYLMIALPVIAGLIAVGEDLLVFLASDKYRDSAVIIPYVVSGMAIDGMVVIVGAGLYIYKRTMVITALVAASAVLNILLNVLLIPHWGITGAAIATLISYAGLALSILWASWKKMTTDFPWASGIKFAAMAAVVFFVVSQVHSDHLLIELVGKISLGALLYGTMVVAFDGRTRDAVRAAISWR
ncbi:MAG: lipopolysaccharide biosynthesis protein [Opitutaceae bacterium]